MTAEYVDSLPDSIRVGPFDFNIVKADSIEDDTAWGTFHGCTLTIARHQLTKAHAADTLMHELLHIIWDIYALGDGEKEERAVHAISIGLTQVYRDNPWVFEWVMQAYD